MVKLRRLVIWLAVLLLMLPSLPASASSESPEGAVVGNQSIQLENSDSESSDTIETPTDPQVPTAPTEIKLLISKAQAGRLNFSSDEFIEIYNPSDQAVELNGVGLRFQSTSSQPSPGDAGKLLKEFSATDKIDPFGTIVVANSNYSEPIAPDYIFDLKTSSGTYAKNVITQDGAVWLEKDEAVIDLLGWSGSVKFEGEVHPGLGNDMVSRCIAQTGVMIDTDNNADDFSIYLDIKPRQLVGCPAASDDSSDDSGGTPDDDGSEEVGEETESDNDTDPGGGLESGPKVDTCESFKINEVRAYSDQDLQFIELVNLADQEANLAGCKLMTNRSTVKNYSFSEETIASDGLSTTFIKDTELTLSKTTSGTVYLIGLNGDEVDSYSYDIPKDNTSWAFIGDGWKQTYSITPGQANIYLEWPACEEGYYRNEITSKCNKVAEEVLPIPCGENQYRSTETGRCRNITTGQMLTPCRDDQYRSEETGRCRLVSVASVLTPCKKGQYRSEDTNRCRSIVATVASVLKPCRDDQFRNPETNRCKQIASTEDVLKPCADGYERNPETNRCRKVAVASLTSADFPVEEVKDSAKSFVAWWALGGMIILGLSIGALEWRHEIRNGIKKIMSAKTK